MEDWLEESIRAFRRELRRITREIEEMLLRPFVDADRGEVEPLYEILERPEELVIRIDLPKVKREDVEVYNLGDRIIVRAKMKEPVKLCDIPAYAGCEIRGYRLEVDVPPDIDTSRIQAVFRMGYLEIVLPRRRAYRVKVE